MAFNFATLTQVGTSNAVMNTGRHMWQCESDEHLLCGKALYTRCNLNEELPNKILRLFSHEN